MDEEAKAILRELVTLNRITSYPAAKAAVRDAFFDKNGEPRRDRVDVYKALDGQLSQRDVAGKAGVNQSSVSRWSREWQRLGLVDGSGRAMFELGDFFPEIG